MKRHEGFWRTDIRILIKLRFFGILAGFFHIRYFMKTLTIKVIPASKKNNFQEQAGQIKVYLTAPAVDGKANKALINFLAKYFNVKKSAVNIIKGLKSRNKTVSINDS